LFLVLVFRNLEITLIETVSEIDFDVENFEVSKIILFCEENFEIRLGASRNGGDGVETYSEPSIGATTKHSPKLFRRTQNYPIRAATLSAISIISVNVFCLASESRASPVRRWSETVQIARARLPQYAAFI
jgi:hypothetical protein